jgi:alpha-amylase
MQDAAAQQIYALEKEVIATRDDELIHAWRKLQTSDHFYYMCTKWQADGDVHTYFSPYESPYDAFILYTNAVSQLRWALGHRRHEQKEASRRARAAARELLAGRSPTQPARQDGRPAKRRAAPAAVQQ